MFILFLIIIYSFFNNYIFQWEVLYSQHFTQYFTIKFMWKVVTNSNSNPLFKLFFYSPISTNNNLSLKIYCENIMKILYVTQFWFLIPYIIFLSFFFSFLFYCFFSSIHEHLPPISIFTLCLTFCFSSYLQNISPLLPFSFVLFLLHTHTQISLP